MKVYQGLYLILHIQINNKLNFRSKKVDLIIRKKCCRNLHAVYVGYRGLKSVWLQALSNWSISQFYNKKVMITFGLFRLVQIFNLEF